ncbi:MAG TPA: hypothetical protein VNI84_09400, partial [Pyrinomonadaceae bacterium]|nr:hypothetical protein [Pyrinomonadaceae bacterium]
VGKNLAISLQEFITLSFLYRKRTIKRILFAFIFQTSALPVQSRLVFITRFSFFILCGIKVRGIIDKILEMRCENDEKKIVVYLVFIFSCVRRGGRANENRNQ